MNYMCPCAPTSVIPDITAVAPSASAQFFPLPLDWNGLDKFTGCGSPTINQPAVIISSTATTNAEFKTSGGQTERKVYGAGNTALTLANSGVYTVEQGLVFPFHYNAVFTTTFQVTIAPNYCVVTSYQLNGCTPALADYAVLGPTRTDSCILTQVPDCGYDSNASISGIPNTIMTALPVTGKVTAGSSTQETVNLATYTADNSLAATYNFFLTATLVGYPVATLPSPKSFPFSLVVKECIVTSYYLDGTLCTGGLLPDYTVLATTRTDSCVRITQVPACGYDSTVSIAGISNTIMTGTVTTKNTVNLTTYTADSSLAATYVVAISATLSGYPYAPLLTATLNLPLVVKSCVVTSYFLTSCTLADYTILETARTDSCVMITQFPACGYDSTVSLAGILNTIMTGTVTTKNTVNLTTYTADSSLAATYVVAISATLSGYPYAPLLTATLNLPLVVKSCVVTSYFLTSCTLADYTILETARTDSCVIITQFPACGYDSTVSLAGILNTIMTGTVTTKNTVNLTTYTADSSLAATYVVAISATLSGYPYAPLSTPTLNLPLVVKSCVVTSYQLAGCAPALADYTVLGPTRTDSCILTQLPACGYDSNVSISGIPNTIMTALSVTGKVTVVGSSTQETVKLITYTADNSLAATYNFFLTATLVGYPVAALPSSKSFPLSLVVKPSQLSIFILNQTLNAVIGQEASLLLPPLTGAVYSVFSKPHYQLLLDDNLLKVKSESDSDIGSQMLRMNVLQSYASGNFTVNLIFSKEVKVAETEINTNTSITENLLLSVLESDSLLKTTHFCTTKETGILSCVNFKGYSYQIDPKKSAEFAQFAKQPILTVSKVNSRGQFSLKFSQAMKIEAFKNTTYNGQLQEVNATTQNDTLVKYKYLLSPKHLRIEVMKSGNTTQPIFTWYARNITNTTIQMQLVFEDPVSISSARKSQHSLVITVLPPALRFFQTISSGAVTKNPLENFTRKLPAQAKLGSVMNSVIYISEIMQKFCQYTALTNLAVQLAVSGSMGQMWSMVNSFQIVRSFNYLETDVPGNVLIVMTKLDDMLELSALKTDQISSELFNFTVTQSPGAAFTDMGDDSKVFTLSIGILFYFGVLGLTVYVLYCLVHCCGKCNKMCKKLQLWLLPKLIFSAALCYQLESSVDFGIGTLLKFEEPNLNTESDIFDFSLSIVAVICLLVLPLIEIIFLCKNKDQMDDPKFKEKWGSLYSQLKTYTPDQREIAIKMLSWFLFRRILTALNLVELRDQTVWLQLTLNMYLCLADVCVYFCWSPYESNLRDIMEKLNSIVVLLLSQLMYMQTDFIPEADRYYIGWYYIGVIGLMILVNFSVVIVAASISSTKKCKKCFVQRKHTEALALKKTQIELKNFRMAQNNVFFGALPSRRSLLVLEISAQKEKLVVDEAKLKQLVDRLLALDNNISDKPGNVPQKVSIESGLEIGSSHLQAERLVDQIDELTYYENQKEKDQKICNGQSLSEIESEEPQISSVRSSSEDQSDQIVENYAPSVFNKAELRIQTNQVKSTATQASDWEIELWGDIQNRVIPANKDAQESARFIQRKRPKIVQDAKQDQTVLKEEIFEKVIKALKAAKNPMAASHFVVIQARDNAHLLSNEISRMSQEHQEAEVKAIIQVCPEYIKNQDLYEQYSIQVADCTAKLESLQDKIDEKQIEFAELQDIARFYQNQADQVRRNLGYASLESVWETNKLLNQKEIEIRKDREEVGQLADEVANLKQKAEMRRRYFT